MTIAKKVEELDKGLEYLFNSSVSAIKDCIVGEMSEEDRDKILKENDLAGKKLIETSLREVEEEAKKEMMEWHNKERNELIEHINAVRPYDRSLPEEESEALSEALNQK